MDSAWGTHAQAKLKATGTTKLEGPSSSSKLIQLQRTTGSSAGPLFVGGAAGQGSTAAANVAGGAGGGGTGVTPFASVAAGTHPGGGTPGVTRGVGSGVVSPHLVHPLRLNWVFWFMHRPTGSKITDYESAMKKIGAFASVEDFWAIYCHLRRPECLPNVSDYHLFKSGTRPIWEDKGNINGGKWIIRLKKGLASRYWEYLVMAVIGDQFDVGDEICGIVLSVRNSEDILSLWNRSANEGRINLKIRDTMKRVLDLPADTTMEYKAHNVSINDQSSFRNTDVFR